jgi:glutamate-1-semialdehyde 2,1-aminomutase
MDSALMSYHPAREQTGALENPNVVLPSKGQVANAAENVIVAPWNRPEMLEQVFARRGPEIAAAIMEPVLCNSGCLMPRDGYLETAREICRRHGALLIFDEVITGFRMGIAGAQGFYGVTPDLATFGKAVAGGLPLSVVAGRREIMEQMFGGGVSFGGTFNGNPVSLAAADAALGELSRDGGALLTQANERGRKLITGIEAAARRHGIKLIVTGFGAAMSLHFTQRAELLDYRATLDDDRERLQLMLRRALEEGLHLVPDGRLYVSAAHTDEDIAETLQVFERVFASLN